jgi:L-threonylcarbamoyladenylate synthase
MSMVDIRIPDTSAINEASNRLASGQLVVLPTETVYGLAAATHNPSALAKIFSLKARPQTNPLIAHVLNESQAQTLTRGWDDRCSLLAERFWPGPLTLVLNRDPSVPHQASAGLETIAVRCPQHPIARSVLDVFGAPVSAPSANRSGNVSPTCAAHVALDYEEYECARGLLVLDGGTCLVGIESTILDLTTSQPCILREGAVDADALTDLLGPVPVIQSQRQSNTPGSAPRHYAPRTVTQVLDRCTIDQTISDTKKTYALMLLSPMSSSGDHHVTVMPPTPVGYGEILYMTLRALDDHGADRLLVECPPNTAGWGAIHDRLQRASFPVSTIRSAGDGTLGGSA